MASNRMSGNLIGLEINGEFVTCEMSCDFSYEADLRPASPILSGRWKEFIAGVRSWSVSVNAAMLLRMLDGASVDTVLTAFLTGATLGIRFMVKSAAYPNFIISGNVIVQSGAINASVNTLAGWNAVLTGSGPFAIEVNTNLVYVLATDDVGDELLQDGNDNLIIADPGVGTDVAINWTISYGGEPTTQTLILLFKNGIEIPRLQSEGIGVLPSSYKTGDTISLYQSAYPAFRWAPGSLARFIVKVDGVTKYDASVSDQNPIDLQSYLNYVIPAGVSVIEISSIGSNESLNYFTKHIQTMNNLLAEEFAVTITDNVEAGLGLDYARAGAATNYYFFNVKGTTGTLTAIIDNIKVTDVTYTLIGEGGYLQTGTIVGLGNAVHTDVPKSVLSLEVSNI